MPTGERRFRAMGTDCHVLVYASQSVAEELADLALVRVELLEQSWSRFRPASELNRLNASAGHGPQTVSHDLLRLGLSMRAAWLGTDGLFDPTVLASMRALGYDTDFATVTARPASALDDVLLAAAPGMSGVTIDESSSTIALPSGVGLDPGAIGKGLAADIVAEELMSAGAHGVLVNLGGDVSLAGAPDADEPWSIGIEDERRGADDPERLMRTLTLVGGRAGVATSTTLKRRWAQGRRHHVLDPRTGSMSASDLVQVTVVAPDACTAEWSATAALLQQADDAAMWLHQQERTAILLTEDRVIDVEKEEPIHG
jgi:thiamine biosynthesis lipoprotein